MHIRRGEGGANNTIKQAPHSHTHAAGVRFHAQTVSKEVLFIAKETSAE